MKFHSRIHPVNYSLLRELPADHPAVQALQIHAEACDVCVGKEIDWPHLGIVGIDQTWLSESDLREHRFSAFAYQYISYDLFLDGWVKSAAEPTAAELRFLDNIPTMRTLLDECEQAAHAAKNVKILPLVAKAREFVDAVDRAVRFRFKSTREGGTGEEPGRGETGTGPIP